MPRAAPSTARREKLLFEAGIKLGGAFHQYIGVPVSARTAGALARAIRRAIELQPYVVRAVVEIDAARGGPTGPGRFGYRYLTPEMLRVEVELAHGGERVVARLEYRPELRYPLMSVVPPGAGSGRRASPSSRRSARRRGGRARRTPPSGG